MEPVPVRTYQAECGVLLKNCQILLLRLSTKDSTVYREALRRLYSPAICTLASYPGLEKARVVGYAQWRDKFHVLEGGRLPKRPGVYSIAEDLTNFKCPDCNATLKSWTKLQNHLTSRHKKRVPYSQADELAMEPRYHRCYICSKVFLCDVNFIRQHVTPCHKITLAKYRKLLGQWNTSRGAVDSQIKRHKEKSIGFHCLFECPHCSQEFGSWLELRSHRFSAHRNKGGRLQCNLPAASFLAKKLTYLQCKLCGEQILRDSTIVSAHWNQQHDGILFPAYLALPERKQKTFVSHGIILCESSVTLPKCTLDNSKLLLETIKRQVPVCPFKFTDLRVKNKKQHLWPKHFLTDEQVTRLVGNLCVFKCDVCSTSFLSWSSLVTHTTSKHGTSVLKDYGAKNIVEARYHRCAICCNILLCDVEVIKRHIKRLHRRIGDKIAFKAYKELAQRMENAGGNLSEEERDKMHPVILQYKARLLKKTTQAQTWMEPGKVYKRPHFWDIAPQKEDDS